MISRQNLILALTLSGLPFVTGCLAVPMGGTIEAQPTYFAQPAVIHSPPVYEVQPVVYNEAPQISIPAPAFVVQPPSVHVRQVAAPSPKVKMKFGGLFGGGPEVSLKAKGGPKMTVNAKGMTPKMKVTSTSSAGGSTKVQKAKVTKGGKKKRK